MKEQNTNNMEQVNMELLVSYLKCSNRTMEEKITEVAEHHKIDRLEAIQLLAEAEKTIITQM